MLTPESNGGLPTVLHTDRLRLRLADPNDRSDSLEVISLYNDPNGGKGGNAQVGINTVEDVQHKHKVHGPKAHQCTLADPPAGLDFLVYLEKPDAGEEDKQGALVGQMAMSFREEIPFPDLGYMLRAEFQGHGYATEAGREVVRYWRDVVGVREIWCGTLDENKRSQRCAERIGFVRAGTFNILFGRPPNELHRTGTAFVLPGMRWSEDMTVRATIGTEDESRRNPELP